MVLAEPYCRPMCLCTRLLAIPPTSLSVARHGRRQQISTLLEATRTSSAAAARACFSLHHTKRISSATCRCQVPREVKLLCIVSIALAGLGGPLPLVAGGSEARLCIRDFFTVFALAPGLAAVEIRFPAGGGVPTSLFASCKLPKEASFPMC